MDSTVTAAILKEAGWNVIGVTLRLWRDVGSGGAPLPYGEGAVEPADAARAAAQEIGVEHHVVDMSNPFREHVVRYFVDEYRSGRTPNPCIVCNRKIKFAALLNKAEELGTKHLATGHYVQVERCGQSGRYLLKKGVDPGKDQSYMLYNLTQDQLQRCLFPLGSLTKKEVRGKAKLLGLTVAERSESQEICFIPGNDYRDFLRRSGLKDTSGPIVDSSGSAIGTHRGLFHYTIGQRRGLGLISPHPLYVLEIRLSDNTLVVGERFQLERIGLDLENVNLVALPSLEEATKVTVKIRYRSPEVPAVVMPLPGEGAARITFDEPQHAVAPGQAAVFYRKETVLGGGWIRSSFNTEPAY